MANPKRPMLSTRSAIRRRGERTPVSVPGLCQVGEGESQTVEVIDLDARGCQIRGLTMALSKSDAVQLWLGPVGPVTASLRWAKRGATGLEFARELGEDELAQATAHAELSAGADNVVTLVRRTR